MIINDLDGYYIVFDTKNWNTELDTLVILLGWFFVIKVLDWFKVTTYGAAASDGGCSFFVLKMP